MPDEITSQNLEALLTDPDFLFLVREEGRPNVFTTVAASTTEMWHSAFIRWVSCVRCSSRACSRPILAPSSRPAACPSARPAARPSA